jgi:hypothetical protein
MRSARHVGAFPTRSLRNLQRLYGLLPGINVAVKVRGSARRLSGAWHEMRPTSIVAGAAARRQEAHPRARRLRRHRRAADPQGAPAGPAAPRAQAHAARAQDIPVCGGGYIHILDTVVLPYKL